MGISTPARRASSRAAAQVFTPSAIILVVARIFSIARPRPSSTPTARFRLSAPLQVRTRSPMPASPAKVSRCPPKAQTSRVISARPRVSNAATVFAPKPSPSQTPAAMAITFFSAPANSTPITSSLVYRRNVGPENSCLQLGGKRGVARGDHDGRRVASSDFAREGRAGEDRDAQGLRRACSSVYGRENLRHPQQRALLDAFGRADEDRFRLPTCGSIAA